VNALSDEAVGKYLNDQCVCSFQKVGTFQVANGQKTGGNVASYFCLPDGAVLHVVAGPVNAATLLREARWVVETRKLALTTSHGDYDKYAAVFGKAHAQRLQQDHHVKLDHKKPRGLSQQAQVHWLLAGRPLVKVEEIYETVFEKILGEKVSTLPVVER
jgi:hypothetical protein